jgi:hypothetical protein
MIDTIDMAILSATPCSSSLEEPVPLSQLQESAHQPCEKDNKPPNKDYPLQKSAPTASVILFASVTRIMCIRWYSQA